MKNTLLALMALLSLHAVADCPDFSGTYRFQCKKVDDHHSTFTHVFVTSEKDGKPATIEVKQQACEKIIFNNLDDNFPEYPLYLNSMTENSGDLIKLQKLKVKDDKITVKYKVYWNASPLMDGRESVSATLERKADGLVRFEGKVKMAHLLTMGFMKKQAELDCTLNPVKE